MCLKNKIIAAVIGICIAAFGIAGINTQTAQAQTTVGAAGTTVTIEQLETIIKSLQQQIALIIGMLQQRNLPVCGNGTCETSKGETAADCASDCGQTGQLVPPCSSMLTGTDCTRAGGLIAETMPTTCICQTTIGGNCTYKDFAGKCTVTKVADDRTVNYTFKPSGSVNISGTFLDSKSKIDPYKGVTSASYLGLACLKSEYELTSAQIKNCKIVKDEVFDCTLSVIKTGSCTPINVAFKDKAVCGNGTCETGETKTNCAKDCQTAACIALGKTCTPTPATCSSSDASSCGSSNSFENTSTLLNQCCSGSTCQQSSSSAAWTCKACSKEGKVVSDGESCCSGMTQIKNCSSSGLCSESGVMCAKCGNGTCGAGENKYNCPDDCGAVVTDNGKAKCAATGGTWASSDCASCTPTTRSERISDNISCATVCVKANICACSSGKYWASREEGCLAKPTACAAEGETINTSGTKKCCPELVAYSPCTSEQKCVADSWTCKKPASTCGKEGATCGTNKCGISGDSSETATKCVGGSTCCEGYSCANGKCVAQSTTCAQKGESLYNSNGSTKSCCSGLNEVSYVGCTGAGYTGAGACFIRTCAKCGDKVCDKGENSTSCPTDCKSICTTIETAPYCPNGKIVTETGKDGCPYLICIPSTCVTENKTFSDKNNECCDGLEKIQTPCLNNGTLCQLSYTCRKPNCVNEGQTFQDSRACCAGLTKTIVPVNCVGTGHTASGSTTTGNITVGTNCISVATYTCKKSTATTCADTCRAKGYANSRCNVWGFFYKNDTAEVSSCNSGEANVGWTTDCTAADTGGGGRTCCCGTETPPTPPIVVPEMCGKSLGSTPTTTQKESCAKYGGQILCANTATQCAISNTGLTTNCGGSMTQCYCSCGGSGSGATSSGSGGTATWGGGVSSIDTKSLSASLAQAIETAKSILNQLISSK